MTRCAALRIFASHTNNSKRDANHEEAHRALALAACLALPVYGGQVTYTHDAAGRLTSATYDDGTIVNYSYDASGNRTVATVTAAPDTTAPSVPAGLTATAVSQSQIDLSWSASTDNVGVTGYTVQRCAGAGCTNFSSIGNPSSTSYSDPGRAAGTAYRYQVSAQDAAANSSAFSTIASATTPDTSAPTVPGTPTFSSVAMTSATASWTAATDNLAVTGYEYRLNSGSWQSLGNVLSVNLTGLAAVTSYTFQVRARDGAGNLGPAGSASFTTTDTAAPGAPGTPTFSAISVTAATADWGAATDNVGVAGYDYRLNSGAWQSLGNVLSVNLTGLSGGTSYTFQVRARDAAGNTGTASSASFTTTAALQATANSTRWTWQYQQGRGTYVSPNIVITASGGAGGYTYSWQRISGDTSTTISSASSRSVAWSRSTMNWNQLYESTWRCLVTDSSGATTYGPNITVDISKNNLN